MTIGTKLGTVATGPLTGWAKIAIGEGGRYVTTKSGACFGRAHDPEIPTDQAWAAVDAYLRAHRGPRRAFARQLA